VNIADFSLTFTPEIPLALLLTLLFLTIAILGLSFWHRARGTMARALVFSTIGLALANPSFITADRVKQKNVVLVVVDTSPSQSIGARGEQSAAALTHLKSSLAEFEDMDVKIIVTREKQATSPQAGEDTRLFGALKSALADEAGKPIAAAILITDGQIHDAPAAIKDGGKATLAANVPLHVFITGEQGETDRRLVVETAPRYGIVGEEAEMTLRAEGGDTDSLTLIIQNDGNESRRLSLRSGENKTLKLPIEHGGANLFEFEIAAQEGELSALNNRAVAIVNGVRDRLRVLLVSGAPYIGERVWRDFLKSDPSVDLVHFTILRPPEKQDFTPVNEMSLISFPVQELFETKLEEFDLVIFDHYQRRGILPWSYLENIVRYVENGGALLEAAGPEFASPLSLYRTPLRDILPGAPTGTVFEKGYRPDLTAQGWRHPVTAGLPDLFAGTTPATTVKAKSGDRRRWGRWFRQVEVTPRRGRVLMNGVGDAPLLILDRFGKGRVAQLLSDHIWLWARRFEGGGPQAELLRRLAHWLMKEPELEEESLTAAIEDNVLTIHRRSLGQAAIPLTVTVPSGNKQNITLKADRAGTATARMAAAETGLYRIDDGSHTALAVSRTLSPPEYADLRASDKILRPLVTETGGGVIWVADGPLPSLRRIGSEKSGAAPSPAHGKDWIGIRNQDDFTVTGISETSLVPGWLLLLATLGGLALAWRREAL